MELRAAVLGARVRRYGSIPCLLIEPTTVSGRNMEQRQAAPGTTVLWMTMEGSIGPEDGGGAAFVASDHREAFTDTLDRLALVRARCMETSRIPVVSPVRASDVLAAVRVQEGRHVPRWEGAGDPEAAFAEIWDRIKPGEPAAR